MVMSYVQIKLANADEAWSFQMQASTFHAKSIGQLNLNQFETRLEA
jgi:hypothetical protein